MKFKDEKEAKKMLKKIVGAINVFDNIKMLKSEGYIENNIVDEAEDEYDNYIADYTRLNFSNREELKNHTKDDFKTIDLLYRAIQYLKAELEDVKKK